MKKISLFLMFFLILSICSCTPNRTQNHQYQFKSESEIATLFTTFKFTVTVTENETSVSTYEVVVNPELMYYRNDYNQYLVDRSNKITYKIDANQKIISKSSNINETTIYNFYLSYLTAHFDINKGNFIKSETNIFVDNRSIELYEEEENIQNQGITSEKYYVDTVLGVCLKRSLMAKVGISKTSIEWEISNLSFAASDINQILKTYNDYETKNESLEFDYWPNTPLAATVPAFSSGNFEIATDNGNECYIMIKNVEKRDVLIYTGQLPSCGFIVGTDYTNEFKQYFYVTYNSDQILVLIKYSNESKLFTMTIKKSTLEEIEKEMAKLQ